MNNLKKSNRAKGGLARAKALTPTRRSEIAKLAATARHKTNKVLMATHKGNFNKELGLDVECYVLNDDEKTAVISQRGMGRVLGLKGGGGSAIPRFASRASMAPYIGPELLKKIQNPLIFQDGSLGPKMGFSESYHGFDSSILSSLCSAILDANSAGVKISPDVVKQAGIILGASSKAGIKGLVYALSGYDATRQEIIENFKLFVKEEARQYEKEFPEALYLEWYRIYNIPKPARNRPWKFMHLTRSQVYRPLARSNGRLQELLVETRGELTQKRLHQFLSEVGVKALRQHLGQLLGIAQLSDDQQSYERNFQKVFGEQPSLPFDD